jgi:hypothetical protein
MKQRYSEQLWRYFYHPNMWMTWNRGMGHTFYNTGVGASDGVHEGKSTLYGKFTGYHVLTLETIMCELGLSSVDLVRIDVEGAEWDVLSKWDHRKIGQLLMEIHIFDPQKQWQVLSKLPYKLFYSTPNKQNTIDLGSQLTQVHELGLHNARGPSRRRRPT